MFGYPTRYKRAPLLEKGFECSARTEPTTERSTLYMDSVKYIGMDVHKEAICIAVLNSSGKLVMECVIETKAITILDFLKGLRGSLHVTFEEGTWAAWLYDLIKPHVGDRVVCTPRRNALLKEGSKSDRIDARKLAELLRSNLLRSVYHGEQGVRKLKELARSYLAISKDLGSRRATPSGVLLPTAGRSAASTPTSAARTIGGS